MDAKTFISKKHDAALDELKALEAEYKPRMDAAQAKIDMAKTWLDELSSETESTESMVSVEDVLKSPSSNWVSARDLTPPARQGV